MKSLVTMRQALADRDLLGGVLGATSRLAWRAILIAAMGESLTHDEREVFQLLTQRASEPLTPIEELFVIVGRRGGKSSAIAALGIYISCLCDHSASLSVGERGVCLILATNTKQASIILGYVVGILRSTPTLSALILNETSEVISLSNGIRHRGPRGGIPRSARHNRGGSDLRRDRVLVFCRRCLQKRRQRYSRCGTARSRNNSRAVDLHRLAL